MAAPVAITNIEFFNNPGPFQSPIRYRVSLEINQQLEEDLEFKVIYVGSSDSTEYDQELDNYDIGPLTLGANQFVSECPAPKPEKIPETELLGATALLIQGYYKKVMVVRVGYFVNNHLEGEAGALLSDDTNGAQDEEVILDRDSDRSDDEDEQDDDDDDDGMVVSDGEEDGMGDDDYDSDDDDDDGDDAAAATGAVAHGSGHFSESSAQRTAKIARLGNAPNPPNPSLHPSSSSNNGNGNVHAAAASKSLKIERKSLTRTGPVDISRVIRDINAEKPRVTNFFDVWKTILTPSTSSSSS